MHEEDTGFGPICSVNGLGVVVVVAAVWEVGVCCAAGTAEELHTDCVIDVSLLALRPVKRRFVSDLPKFAPNFDGARREPPEPGFFISAFDEAITMALNE